MKRNVLVFGSVSGLISVSWFFIAIAFLPMDEHMDYGMYLGYAAMIIANIFLIVGVKNYRDKYNGGFISFGKALKVGLLIALVASTFYVASWLIYYYSSGSDFIQVYTDCVLRELKESGASAKEIAIQTKEMQEFGVMYQNPLFNAMVTYMEILPMGILFALITAAIFRKKDPNTNKVKPFNESLLDK